MTFGGQVALAIALIVAGGAIWVDATVARTAGRLGYGPAELARYIGAIIALTGVWGAIILSIGELP